MPIMFTIHKSENGAQCSRQLPDMRLLPEFKTWEYFSMTENMCE